MNNPTGVGRMHYRKKIYVGQEGEVFISASGTVGLGLSRVHSPSTEEIRSMLIELRIKMRWSRGMMASVLGASTAVVRSWENRARQPCACAKKLIWMIHTLCFGPEALLGGVENVVMWGRGEHQVLDLHEEGPASGQVPGAGSAPPPSDE